MTTFVRLVRGAVAVLLVAETIDLRRPVAGPDAEPPEGVLQRLQELLAKLRSSLDGKIRVIRNIRQPVDVGDLAVEDFDKRILPKFSAPFTVFGVLTACPSEHPRTAPRELLAKLLVFRLEFANLAAQRVVVHGLGSDSEILDRVEELGHGHDPFPEFNNKY
jgi:hypothetical protein